MCPGVRRFAGCLIPTIEWNGAFLTTLVAILGTTISPYLFIWQSSQEAEEQRIDPDKNPWLTRGVEANGVRSASVLTRWSGWAFPI